MVAVPTILLLLLPLRALAQTSAAEFATQLTAAALQIEGAISPTCQDLAACQSFVDSVVPRCQKLQGDAGCWCGNHDPLHYCAICMSNPTDNQTTPDQTAAALAGHTKYHQLCNAFEASLNGTSSPVPSNTASATSGQSSSTSPPSNGSKTPIGAIVGGVVGGIAVLLISAFVLVCWLRSRKNENRIRPSSVSLFSAPASSMGGRPISGYAQPQPHSPPPQMGYNAGYSAPAVPYNGTGGVYSPPLTSNTSYSKYPEPMTAG